MRHVGLAVAMVVGCYAPRAPVGLPCTTECPDDQICDRGVCRLPGEEPPLDASPDATPDGDPDGDGVLSSADNCDELPNADQHDEDGDRIGDVCDGCPHRSDGGGDRDADGVGDACDPRPDAPGDRIAVFDPFVGPRPGWDLSPGWRYAGDRLHVDTTADYAILAKATGNSVIAIAGRVTWRTTTPRQITLSFGGGGKYHYCEWYEGADFAYAALTQADGNDYTVIASQGLPELTSGAFELVAIERAAQQRAECLMTLVGRNDQLAGSTPAAMIGTEIGIGARHGAFDFDYLVQITSP